MAQGLGNVQHLITCLKTVTGARGVAETTAILKLQRTCQQDT